ncbi:uncharacterized protein LOC118459077 isoform X1 [Anopheles albimanus]|uniref:uncharacterized protein LOC118459077 isoform X1 n=1 Tax=Anopheles albimanus TaxID=7167 RepID=UPI00163F0DDF|nr:uncharacterized protein LOC118459077 isoform X1 [Anopheles albimanus]XP_035778016.1 uncharacterized protein LOC118459077 isoform X2 [Anopheles albimanus]XP_035778017.1 uncharacterized protein LOC118459077 isoform X1 [Anopheles albimanus]
MSINQEGLIKKSTHHSSPSAVPLSEFIDSGNGQKEDVGKISNTAAVPQPTLSSLKPCTNTGSQNTAPENESVSIGQELLMRTNRKLDLLLKKMNRLQKRVTVIEKNMMFLENHKKVCASTRKEPATEVPGNSNNTFGMQDSLLLPFSPVSCLFELEKLEEMAKDMHFINYVKMQVLRIVGIKVVEGEGLSYCWRIVDLFFTRFFMTQCTWSGRIAKKTGTSKGLKKKIRFKDFDYVINLFYVTGNYADPLISKEETESVLRRAIKNANNRFQSGPKEKPSTIPDDAEVIANEEILPNMNTIDNVESYEVMEFDPLEIKSEPES